MHNTRIYLVRHAEAEGNIQRIFHAHYNSNITENGYKQLERLRQRFEGIPLDAVYSSDLTRAVLTAQAASAHTGLPVIKTERLREIGGGLWEQVPFAELPKRFPKVWQSWEQTPHACRLPEGESMAEVRSRMVDTIRQIAAQHAGQSVLVVSHGCAIRNYMCAALGLPLEQLGQTPWCDNTAVSVIEYDQLLQPHVTMMGDASHLGEYSTLAKQDWWKK